MNTKYKHKEHKDKHGAATSKFNEYINKNIYPYNNIYNTIKELNLLNISKDEDNGKENIGEIYQILCSLQILFFEQKNGIQFSTNNNNKINVFNKKDIEHINNIHGNIYGFKWHEIDVNIFQNIDLDIKRSSKYSGYDYKITSHDKIYKIQLTTVNLQKGIEISETIEVLTTKVRKAENIADVYVFILSLFPHDNIELIKKEFETHKNVIVFDAHQYYVFCNIIKNSKGEYIHVYEALCGNYNKI